MTLTLVLVIGCIGLSLAQIPITCKRVSPCICQDQNGRFVDLRPLARHDGTPRYQDVPNFGGREPSKTVYSYNPCYGFNEGPNNGACKDVAVCQSSNGTSNFLDLGDQKSATFSHFDNGNLSVVYTSKDKQHKTIVSLYCSYDGGDRTFYVQGDMGDNVTWLQLWTKYACPRNESDNDDFEYDQVMSNTTLTRPVFTTPPTPGVVTITARPGPSPTSSPATVSLVLLLLLAILVCVALILAVMVGSMMIRNTRRRFFRDRVVYQPVPTEPQAYYDKSFGIIL